MVAGRQEHPLLAGRLVLGVDPLRRHAAPGGGPRPREASRGDTGRHAPLASRDGTILLSLGAERNSGHWKRIARIDVAAGTSTYLTDAGQSAVDPDLSPDGTRVAFAMSPDTESRIDIPRRLWVMNADGAGKRRLTSD